MKKTVLLVDDHALVRAGLKGLVNQVPGFTVVGGASSIDEALLKMQETVPDIVIADINLGKEDGLKLLSMIKQHWPAVIIVILSMHSSEKLISEALRRGARAYLVKDAAPAELEVALQAIVRGETFLSPTVSTKMIHRFVNPPASDKLGLESLTPRQIEILTLFAKGKTAKEIAYDLKLSEKTVSAHRNALMERLGISDVIGLVLFAVKNNLIDVDNY